MYVTLFPINLNIEDYIVPTFAVVVYVITSISYQILIAILQKQFENLTMQVSWRTPTAKIDELEKLMNEWLATEENRWFQPSTSIMFQNIAFQRHLELTIGISHNR